MKAGYSQLHSVWLAYYSDPEFNLQHRNRNEGGKKEGREMYPDSSALWTCWAVPAAACVHYSLG